jgi:hypothetical protein
MADAAGAIGRSLSALGNFKASSLRDIGLLQRFGICKDDFHSLLIREHLAVNDWLLLEELHAEWSPVLQNLPSSRISSRWGSSFERGGF